MSGGKAVEGDEIPMYAHAYLSVCVCVCVCVCLLAHPFGLNSWLLSKVLFVCFRF